MGNNVSTLPSSDVNKISINWIIFNPKEKEIDAKKLKIGKGAYVPEVEDVQNTYIIEKDNVWMRCVKVANKLRNVKNATIQSEEKIRRLKEKMAKKYEQKMDKQKSQAR